MLNSLAAKLHHKSLCVKDLNVKYCLHFFHKNASFVKNFYDLSHDHRVAERSGG